MWVAVEWSSMILCISLIRRVTHVDDLVKAQCIHCSWIIYHMFFIFILFWSVYYMTIKFCCIFMLCCITTLRSHHHSYSSNVQVNLNTLGRSFCVWIIKFMESNQIWWLIRFWLENSKNVTAIPAQRNEKDTWLTQTLIVVNTSGVIFTTLC